MSAKLSCSSASSGHCGRNGQANRCAWLTIPIHFVRIAARRRHLAVLVDADVELVEVVLVVVRHRRDLTRCERRVTVDDERADRRVLQELGIPLELPDSAVAVRREVVPVDCRRARAQRASMSLSR
jgi:hypothetical protein